MQELLGGLDPTDSDTLARLQTVITECALAESRGLFQEITADSQNEEIAELHRRFDSDVWCDERWGRLLQDWPT